jgi:predicted TIM-barrel enzyme
MAPPTDRDQILASLRARIAAGKAIVGAGAGIGLSAKFIEAGGGDLIIIYNSGRFRMAGRGSLSGLMPYGDANGIVVEMVRASFNLTHISMYLYTDNGVTHMVQWQANEVIPVVKKTPVIAGVCGTDPFRNIPAFLKQLRDLGFAGVQNFPTVGLIDGQFRANLEETGMGYDLEVDMIREARSLNMLTTPYVFNVDESRQMADAGADVLVAHMGLTTSGSIGAATGKTLDECVKLIQEIRDAAVEINPDVIVLCHGGPIAAPKDAEYVLSRTKGVHGFYGASSMERLPVETAITEITRSFKQLKPRL